jgi:predicted restriction endonuclease
MTREELLERLGRVNVSRRGHRPALYKPLLLLLLLSRTRKNGVREISFAEIESDLKSLVERYSPEDSAESVGQPWWHLPTDGLWRVYDEERAVVRELGTPRGDQRVPSLDRLRRQHG